MIDPRREAIFVRRQDSPEFEDKTSQVLGYRAGTERTYVTFAGRVSKEFAYSPEKVLVLRDPAEISLADGARVEVRGSVWKNVTEVRRFEGADVIWWRLFYLKAGQETFRTYSGPDVRVIHDSAQTHRAAAVLDYWRSIVARLPDDDPLRPRYENLDFVHPESVLGRYLNGAPIDSSTDGIAPLIFPFSFNLSQREAVEKALHHRVSVIDGPPGTGKTQTILNLIANIIASPGRTVGVVSFNNAAVDNVRDKLAQEGIGYVAAGLGHKEKREEFFQDQPARNALVDGQVDGGMIPAPPTERIVYLDRRLCRLRETELQVARWRGGLEAYRLERDHFRRYFERQELPELEGLPLLRGSSGHILDYLAETELMPTDDGLVRSLVRRIRRYVKYGSLRGIEQGDTDAVLQLQRAYYDKKINELQWQVEQAEAELEHGDFGRLADEHRQLSSQALRAGLRQRYAGLKRVGYSRETYRKNFTGFTTDYPVILSTCHSLGSSVAQGHLLDYLIIDESSQVNLLAAGLALACARNVVVVGDLSQLQHIIDASALEGADPTPAAAYDYRRHNILSSLIELYGDFLPRTMLREHYRCDPAIIGFCNKKFYGGQLIPFEPKDREAQPLVVVRTVEGNHMRRHREGGRSNQREVDVIEQEVIPRYCAGTHAADIGVTTPYRRQVGKITDALLDSIEADTVHKFQGREKDVVIMTTVLDETWRGRTGLDFADDPHLVNVAVSRAVKRFVLVTNNEMLPKSRNLRDLIDYIRYHNPAQDTVDSAVVSVFDLLYRDYSARLRPLAGRLKNKTRYKSENIIWTVLDDILAEGEYSGLTAVAQVFLRNLILDPAGLSPDQAAYIRNGASVDFVVYNRVTNRPVLLIEVDGFEYHENSPEQRIRDAHKNAICASYGIPLLRLPTTGSGEEQLIRQRLDVVMNQGPGEQPGLPPSIIGR